jgi:hypothetical protein
MDSSPGFGSAASDSSRPIQTRFRFGSLSLNLARHQQLAGPLCKKYAVTINPIKGIAPTACKRMVSGTISPTLAGYFSPFPHGTGSLSVTVSI